MLIPSPAFNVRKLASPEAGRYTMQGVLVERQADGKPRMVATDGHVLGVVTWAENDPAQYPTVEGASPAHEGKPFSAILDSAPLAPFSVPPKSAKIRPLLRDVILDETTANGVVTLASTDLDTVKRASVRSIDGTFPTFEGVMPKGQPRASALLDASLLRRLLEAAEKSSGKGAVRLSIFEEVCCGPIKVESVSKRDETDTYVTFLGCIMPITDETREEEIKARRDAAKAKADARDQAKAAATVA